MPERDAPHAHTRARWRLTALLALALLVAYHAWWLVRMRDGASVDIDEAGYVTIALNDLAGLRAGSLHGLWDAFAQQVPFAPLTPLLAVPALAVHKAILMAFAAELLALAVLVPAVYGVARRLTDARWAVLAALVVAAMPGVVDYTREFSFALPCASASTVSIWALLRSDHLRRTGWALLWGAAGGLAVLARTMALGFVPGLLAAGLLWAATAPAGARARALSHAAAGALAGLAVALTWYRHAFHPALDYLRGYGYGSVAAQYGQSHPLLSTDWWLRELQIITRQDLFLPLLVVLALVLVAALPLAWGALRAPARGAALRRAIASPAAPALVFVAAGYLALSSTQNEGSAFALPLLPAAAALVVALASRLPLAALRATAAAAFVVVALVQLVAFAQVGGPAERLWVVHAPLIGITPVLDPRPPSLQAVAVQQNELRFGPRDRGWLDAAGRLDYLATRWANAHGRAPIVAFATRGRLLNTNTLQLAALLSSQPVPPLAQLTPDGGDTTVAYRRFLSDPLHGQPNVLVTRRDAGGDFVPVVTQARAVAAARSLGFRPFASVRQPDGRSVRLWWLERGPSIPVPPTVKPS